MTAEPSSAAVAAPATRIALVGLPGTGKSAVAKALARRRGWRLVDTDALVEESTGASISDLFSERGEAGFRALELGVLRGALTQPGETVIACGGGLMTTEAARSALLGNALVVWLDGPDGLLLARMGSAEDRPLLRDDPAASLAHLRTARAGTYGAAHLRVDVRDGDVEDVCDRVEDAITGVRLRLDDQGDGGGEADLESLAVDLAVAGVPGGGSSRVVPGPQPPAVAHDRVEVRVEGQHYPVFCDVGLVDHVGAHLPSSCRRVAVVADRRVLPLARRVLASCRREGRSGSIISVRGGDQLKTWSRAGRLVEGLARLRLERGDAVVSVGGGTVGDVTAFAASVYLRGVACIQVPTTLLAMVDSAVGGKTGVNLVRGKNLAGTFSQPVAVLCDLESLTTLAHRPLRAALAEVVKYVMILPEPGLEDVLDSRLDELLRGDIDVLRSTVLACCATKAAVVADDQRERGRRALLNYGHTAGHALETVTGYSILHGEAVAFGMRVAGAISEAVLGCPAQDVRWQNDILARCGLVRRIEADAEAILMRTGADKKAVGGRALWVLLHARGRASIGHDVSVDIARTALSGVLGQ